MADIVIDMVDSIAEPAGVSIVILAGLVPGQGELFVYVADDGAVRTLWPVHGIPARLPERPFGRGLPNLADLVRAFVAAPTKEVPDAL